MVPPTISEFNSEGLGQFRQIYKRQAGAAFFNCPCVTDGSCVSGDNTLCLRHGLLIVSIWRNLSDERVVFAAGKD